MTQEQVRPIESMPAVRRVRTAYQQVADQLLSLVLDGTLAAGDKLPPEGDLSAMFGVSRSTVREALRSLASRDLIHTVRGTSGGTFVSRVQVEEVSGYLETTFGLMSGSADIDVCQMLEARELLEVPAVRLAAVRRDPEHLTALRDAVERDSQARDRGEKFRDHRHFHAVIAAASANPFLELMSEPVFRVLRARFLKPDIPPEFWYDVDRDHVEIVRLVEAGDADGAAEVMRRHLRAIRAGYVPAPEPGADA